MRRPIAKCNAILSRDKAEYNSTVIRDNSHDPKRLYSYTTHVYTSQPILLNEVSENELLKIMKNSPKKSCLLDSVSTLLLKDCVEILLLSITKLVNLSLNEGVFPQKFKKVVVTPLNKKALPK